MKISRVTLENFRSFYGSHVVELAEDDVKRVTVIHAENGGGKTNFLNAIYWCVTGRFTPRFNQPNILINKTAQAEGARQCSVELELKIPSGNGETEYAIRRTATSTRDTTLSVFHVEAGNSTPIPRPEAFLNALFPPGLVDWFFFDAEAIGSLSLSGGEDFKRDIRKVLGFELIDDFLSDMEKVIVKLQREIAALSRNSRIEELANEMSNIQHLMPMVEADLQTRYRELALKRAELETVRTRLGTLPQSKELERRRVSVEQKRRQLSAEKQAILSEYSQLIGRSAPAALLTNFVSQLEGKLQDEEIKGRLPAPYSDQLVKDILDNAQCICGRAVQRNSPEHSCITDLLKFAATSDVNAKLLDIRLAIRTVESTAADYPSKNKAILARRSAVETQLADCEDELREISEQLGKINRDEISRLETEKKRLDQECSEAERKIGAQESQLEDARRTLSSLKTEIENATRTQKTSDALAKALNKAKGIDIFVSNKLKRQETQSLNIFTIELNNILDGTFTKGYRASISQKDYRIELYDANNHRVPDSTGEGQVLKFSFVSTMVALAARKTQAKVDWMVPPTVAPLVLDAPFSALDKTYQGKVAKNLASQTTQLILMISSAHWDTAIEDSLKSSTGKRYLFVSNDMGPRGAKPIKSITIDRKEYAMNAYEADSDGSTIVGLPL
jgi:DNA sulfur modification protein DndD